MFKVLPWLDVKVEYTIEQQRQFKQLVDLEYTAPTDVVAYRVGRGRVTLVKSRLPAFRRRLFC